ncbi:MAG TPA: ROK family transcriptional regulator [Ktedonobacteraceae bacterium]
MALNPTTRDLRRANRRTILKSMFFDGTISRLDVSQRSGLSTGTVTNVINELLAEGIVLESGYEASEGGRRRTILTLNPEYGYFLGGEVGETEIAIELFDLTLHKLRDVRYPLSEKENNPAQIVQYIVEGATSLLRESQVPQDKILGLGLGLPGIVAYTDDEVVSAPAWGWEPVPLKALLSAHVSYPLYIDNGAKTMALAEMQINPGSPTETLATLQIGTGIGAGIIYEGKLYRGATNSAGEWGHMIMALDGQPCRCGRRGCLEAYVGAPGIIHHLREFDANHPLLQIGDEIGTILALIRIARNGDPIATQVLHDTIHYLGAGVANLLNLFNPRRVIIGGWLGLRLGEFALPELLQIVERYALKQPYEVAEIGLSRLGRDGVSIGAAMLVVEDFFENVGGRKNFSTSRT